MVIRSGRRGRFLGCSGYPQCRHTEDLPDTLA
jgi:restriction system protein